MILAMLLENLLCSLYDMFMDILFVFMGGALGALARYLILSVSDTLGMTLLSVFIINIIGCFVIGFVSYVAIKRHNVISDNMNKMLSTGFAGGFTTFSGLTKPIHDLFVQSHWVFGVGSMFANFVVGLIFVAWGMNVGYYFMSWLIRTNRIKWSKYD